MESSNNWPYSTSGYQIQAVIGQGSFGVVYSALVLQGSHRGQKVAVKVINLVKFPDHSMQDIRREIQIMSLSHHPNVIRYYTVFIQGKFLWLVMPFLQAGSLGFVIRNKFPQGIRDQALIATILKSTLQALVYFHSNNQIHRDIKAQNILIHGDGQLFLSDFGVAAKLKNGVTATTFAGSPCWMAPEVIDDENHQGYDCKADIWSFGITALEILKGLPPHANEPPMKVIVTIIGRDPPQLGRHDQCDSNLKELVNSCLRKDPKARPMADQLLRNKFFKKARGIEYVRKNVIGYLQPIEKRLNGTLEEKEKEEAEDSNWDWDFQLSDDYQARREVEKDPLARIGNEEIDPLDELEEDDFQ